MDTRHLSYEDAFAHSALGVVETTLEGDIVAANSYFLELLGYSLTELTQLDIYTITPTCWTVFENNLVIKEALPKGLTCFEKELITKNGEVFPIRITVRIDQVNNQKRFWAMVQPIESLSAPYLAVKLG